MITWNLGDEVSNRGRRSVIGIPYRRLFDSLARGE
jgi:hypothetical protein